MEKTDNELIAEFMGMTLESINHEKGTDYDWIGAPNNMAWTLKSAPPFNSSWDWIISAVETIEKIEGVVTVLKNKRFQITYGKKKFSCHTVVKLNSVYRVVVEFIKWYDTQKQ